MQRNKIQKELNSISGCIKVIIIIPSISATIFPDGDAEVQKEPGQPVVAEQRGLQGLRGRVRDPDAAQHPEDGEARPGRVIERAWPEQHGRAAAWRGRAELPRPPEAEVTGPERGGRQAHQLPGGRGPRW